MPPASPSHARRAGKNVTAFARLVWRTGRPLCVASLLLRACSAAVPIGTFWTSKLIIDAVVRAGGRSDWPREVWWALAAQGLLFVLGDVLTRATYVTDTMLMDRFQRDLGARMIDHANQLDLEIFADPTFHDRMERARAQSASRIAVLANITQFLQQAVTLLSLIAGLALFSPMLVLFQTITFVPLLISEGMFARRWYQLVRLQTPLRRLLDYLLELGTRGESAKEIQAFGFGDHLRDEYWRNADALARDNATRARDRAFSGGALNAVSTLAYSGAYAYLVWQALRGAIGIGDLTFLGLTLQRSRTEFQGLFTMFSRAAEQALLLNDVFEFFDVKPRIAAATRDAASALPALPAPRPIRGGFELQGVSFAYTGSGSRAVLRDVSFRVDVGETLAIVGENGAGKTTLIKLLMRLYDPTEGRILLDGVDLRDYDVRDLRAQFSLVFQDFVRYELSVRDNIGLGDVSARDDAGALARAARRAMALPMIEGLPKGFNQVLGRRFDGGQELSGGQWQRLAIARACIRTPQIVVLDEPTAALDVRSEALIWEQIRAFMNGRTALLVSHRISTVRTADRILVLRDGRIAERGTHHQLVERAGLYSELFELQSVGYR
jgi:ATP-binding cassette, subfamily B, bacterial